MIKIDQRLTSKITELATASPRRRKNYNFHRFPEDTLQRLINAMEPGTYVHPHKHENPDKREAFLVLTGTLLVVEFDDAGNITDHIILNRNLGNFGTEIAERTYHTIISLEKGSIAYEAKDGPYYPADDKYFAEWAPPENSLESAAYISSILTILKISPVG
ncbi:MAG: WbuC family cupin fold metalloprotein [Bacteroidales bacterium]